jgi:hypothetical protein
MTARRTRFTRQPNGSWSFNNSLGDTYEARKCNVSGWELYEIVFVEGREHAVRCDGWFQTRQHAVSAAEDGVRERVLAASSASHTVRGKAIGSEGIPYGTTHDYDCPACATTSFTASPRSETYWAS